MRPCGLEIWCNWFKFLFIPRAISVLNFNTPKTASYPHTAENLILSLLLLVSFFFYHWNLLLRFVLRVKHQRSHCPQLSLLGLYFSYLYSYTALLWKEFPLVAWKWWERSYPLLYHVIVSITFHWAAFCIVSSSVKGSSTNKELFDLGCRFLPVKPENLRGALTDGSAGGAISWPVVFSLPCTFFFGLALTLAIRSARLDDVRHHISILKPLTRTHEWMMNEHWMSF